MNEYPSTTNEVSEPYLSDKEGGVGFSTNRLSRIILPNIIP
jgi:hypothetical protein